MTDADDIRAWLASRPHTAACRCSRCQPDRQRELSLEDRLRRTCPACGVGAVAEDRCANCAVVSSTFRRVT